MAEPETTREAQTREQEAAEPPPLASRDAVGAWRYGQEEWADFKAREQAAQVAQESAQSPGERLFTYYTDLKAHLREQEQLGLPLDASERRQEVLAFAEQWQAAHGSVHDDAPAVQRDYAALQGRLVASREAQGPVVEASRAQSRDAGMEY